MKINEFLCFENGLLLEYPSRKPISVDTCRLVLLQAVAARRKASQDGKPWPLEAGRILRECIHNRIMPDGRRFGDFFDLELASAYDDKKEVYVKYEFLKAVEKYNWLAVEYSLIENMVKVRINSSPGNFQNWWHPNRKAKYIKDRVEDTKSKLYSELSQAARSAKEAVIFTILKGYLP